MPKKHFSFLFLEIVSVILFLLHRVWFCYTTTTKHDRRQTIDNAHLCTEFNSTLRATFGSYTRSPRTNNKRATKTSFHFVASNQQNNSRQPTTNNENDGNTMNWTATAHASASATKTGYVKYNSYNFQSWLN